MTVRSFQRKAQVRFFCWFFLGFFTCVLFVISDNRTSKQFVARTLHLPLISVGTVLLLGGYYCGNLQEIAGRHHAVHQGPVGKEHSCILLYASETFRCPSNYIQDFQFR